MPTSSANAFPFPTSERHAPPQLQPARPVDRVPDEDAVDHGLEESFPASDPVSVNVTKVEPKAPRVGATPQQVEAPSSSPSRLRTVLRAGLIAGAFASVAATAVLARRRGQRWANVLTDGRSG